MLEALKESLQHQADFDAFDFSLRKERSQEVKGWEEMIKEWEADNTKPCPYLNPEPSEFLPSL